MYLLLLTWHLYALYLRRVLHFYLLIDASSQHDNSMHCLNSLAKAHLVQKSNSIDQHRCFLEYENQRYIECFQLVSQCCNALWTTGDKERRSYLWHILIKSKSGPILISLIKSVLIGWKCNLIDSFYIEMITPVSNYIVCFYLWTCKFLKHSFPPPQYYYMGVIFLFRSMALDSNGKQQNSKKMYIVCSDDQLGDIWIFNI